MARLDGRTAVVTGAGRGIGRGVAMLLAAEGAQRRRQRPRRRPRRLSGTDNGPAAQVVEEIKRRWRHRRRRTSTSIATVEGGENLIKTALDNWGRLDILVNVAGILRDRMIFNMSEQEWDDVIAVHLNGHFNTIKPASILMRQQRYGRIINFSSISGLGGNPGQANYGAAKAGIAGLTRVVARDLGRYGVTCNAIAPGANTRMTATHPADAGALRAARRHRRRPAPDQASARPTVPPLREPEYVAPMTVWLCTRRGLERQRQDLPRRRRQHRRWPRGVADAPRSPRTACGRSTSSRPSCRSILMNGLPNPAPPPPDLDLPGRRVAATT